MVVRNTTQYPFHSIYEIYTEKSPWLSLSNMLVIPLLVAHNVEFFFPLNSRIIYRCMYKFFFCRLLCIEHTL